MKIFARLNILLKTIALVLAISFGLFYVFRSHPKSYDTLSNLPPFNVNQNISATAEQVEPPVIRLHDKNGIFFCTAFVVSDVYAITAGHCLNDDGSLSTKPIKIFVQDDDSKAIFRDTSVVAKAAAINNRGDTGLLLGDFSKFRRLKIIYNANMLLQIVQINKQLGGGGIFISIGFPYGDGGVGIQSQLDMPCGFSLCGRGILYPGMSGGPVMDPITKYVVGINSAVYDTTLIFSSLVSIFASFDIQVVE